MYYNFNTLYQNYKIFCEINDMIKTNDSVIVVSIDHFLDELSDILV